MTNYKVYFVQDESTSETSKIVSATSPQQARDFVQSDLHNQGWKDARILRVVANGKWESDHGGKSE